MASQYLVGNQFFAFGSMAVAADVTLLSAIAGTQNYTLTQAF